MREYWHADPGGYVRLRGRGFGFLTTDLDCATVYKRRAFTQQLGGITLVPLDEARAYDVAEDL
jgi:hypothetical protein